MISFIRFDFIDFLKLLLELFLLSIIPITIIFLVNHKKKIRYFVERNSPAVKKAKSLVKSYAFKRVPDLVLKHSYDNVNFYTDISCLDYLVYELSKQVNYYEKILDNVEYNRQKFIIFLDQFEKIEKGNFPSNKYKYEKLVKIENQILKEIKEGIKTSFSIDVILTRTNIEGEVFNRKEQNFSSAAISRALQQIKNNRNGFYLDENIWASICRVERGKVSNKLRFFIYKRDGYRCQICGQRDYGNNLEIDHIIPISKGGKTTPENLQTLCHRCNIKKGNKIL